MAILDEMEKTKIERDQLLNSICEPPSFSIGLTQMDINDNLGLDSLDVNTLFDDQVMLYLIIYGKLQCLYI